MGVAISTAGTTVTYAWETISGTRPTTGYIQIPDIKEVPALDSAPEALDSTVLTNKKYKSSIDGLIDLGGNINFTANLTNEFQTAWETFCAKKAENKKKDCCAWVQVDTPGLNKAIFIPCYPVDIGSPARSVNAVLEASAYITPCGDLKWEEPIAVTANSEL